MFADALLRKLKGLYGGREEREVYECFNMIYKNEMLANCSILAGNDGILFFKSWKKNGDSKICWENKIKATCEV